MTSNIKKYVPVTRAPFSSRSSTRKILFLKNGDFVYLEMWSDSLLQNNTWFNWLKLA
jgi:hypothetical protein